MSKCSGDFPTFDKIARLNRTAVITEKIDGTNGLIEIERVPLGASGSDPNAVALQVDWAVPEGTTEPTHEYVMRVGSRSRYLRPGESDNFGFRAWAMEHATELFKLGEGRHYGEWYGKGIQRGYGLNEKRFMLFNSDRWSDPDVRPACCEVATVLGYAVTNLSTAVDVAIEDLRSGGSAHVPGFDRPEGVVVYHTAARQYFKVTLEKDEAPKGLAG